MINRPESTSPNVDQRTGTLGMVPYVNGAPSNPEASSILGRKDKQKDEHYSVVNGLKGGDGNRFLVPASEGATVLPFNHPCSNFTFPPPPPPTLRRIGPRRKFEFILVVLIITVALNIGTQPVM